MQAGLWRLAPLAAGMERSTVSGSQNGGCLRAGNRLSIIMQSTRPWRVLMFSILVASINVSSASGIHQKANHLFSLSDPPLRGRGSLMSISFCDCVYFFFDKALGVF